MSKQRRLAISYTRFSSPLQAKGDSQDRQDRMFRQFCQWHNLTPLPKVYADKGKSGYKDEHRKKGALGLLIAHAKDGKFEPGTVIVAEAWDRFGRLRPDQQVALIGELLKTGAALGVCRLNEIFTEEDFGTHKWTTLAVFVQLAYLESKQKAERVAASHQSRRERARRGEGLGGWPIPAWVQKQGNQLVLIRERAAAVKRIFHLAAEGLGHRRIAGALTREGVPPFGKVKINPDRTRSQFSGRWTTPYIALILNDRRAVGEVQPRKMDGTPDGPPIPNYYPAAVTEDEYLLAKAGQEQRRQKDSLGRRLGPRQGKYTNLFKGFLVHAPDREGFVLHNKGTKKRPELLLVTARSSSGRGLGGRPGHSAGTTFPYHVFETAILRCLREVDPAKVLPAEKEVANQADQLRARLAKVRREMAQYQEDLRGGYSKALAALLREKEIEEGEIGNELQEELARTVKPTEKAWGELPTLADMVREGGDEARLKLRAILRQVIESIWVVIVPHGRSKRKNPRKGAGSCRLMLVQVFFVGGASRSYLLFYQPAANRRPGGWCVASWAGWDTKERFSLKNPRRPGQVQFQLGPRGMGAAELVEVLAQSLRQEGGTPEPDVIGPLVQEVLGRAGSALLGGPPKVEGP